MAKEDENRLVAPETPIEDEKEWLTWTIVVAFFAVLTVFCAFIWVFAASTDGTMESRARVVTPVVAFCVAVVTFFAAIWRGMVTSRQADQQRIQNNMAEEVRLGDLYQKGAELLNDDREANREIGMSILRMIIENPVSRFSVPTMDLAANYIGRNHKHSHDGGLFDMANKVLKIGFERHQLRSTVRKLVFDAAKLDPDDPDAELIRWQFVYGIDELVFHGGEISGGILFEARFNPTHSFTFETHSGLPFAKDNQTKVRAFSVRFLKAEVDASNTEYDQCWFEECQITTVNTHHLRNSMFSRCDFSGAEIILAGEFSILFNDHLINLAHLENVNECYYVNDRDFEVISYGETDQSVLNKWKDKIKNHLELKLDVPYLRNPLN